MRLYTQLSKVPLLNKSYAFKFLFVAFLGIHLPLIGIIFFLAFYEKAMSVHNIFYVTLSVTLVATVITLICLRKLIKPVEAASKALELYKNKRLLPTNLPNEFEDEAGLLMTNIISSIKSSENLLKQKQDLIFLLSHDLKNFAATPASLAQVILDEKPADNIKSSAELILLSTERQTEFIESILSLMQEEEKIASQHLRVKSVSFSDIVATVNQDTRTEAKEQKY
ncbi:hypothetical protein [Flavobacterium sp. 3HN19-14]|uniref:hypothetical protein n=1 Tax=Flavobacterium sp. 3HN19-14 TaxID=3448133 RepID=UPI003EE38222